MAKRIKLKSFRKLGAEAYSKGIPCSHCPLQYGPHREQWQYGWRDARNEAQRQHDEIVRRNYST